MITDAEVEEGLKLCCEATEGPWEAAHNSKHIAIRPNPNGSIGDYHYIEIHGWDHEATANGQFIAAARTLLPRALEEIKRLQTQVEMLQKLLPQMSANIKELGKLHTENAKLQRVKEVAEDILLKAKLTIERVDLPIELTILEPLQDVLKDLDEEGK